MVCRRLNIPCSAEGECSKQWLPEDGTHCSAQDTNPEVDLAQARQQIATLTAERDEARQDGERLLALAWGEIRLLYWPGPVRVIRERDPIEYEVLPRDLPGLRAAIDQAREAVKK